MQHETRKKLNELIAATGHVLAVEDFDDIAQIDALAEKVVNPGGGLNSPLNEHAFFVRGVPVYPLTLAHLTYLDEAPDLLALSDADQVTLMLWAVTRPCIATEDYNPAMARPKLRQFARRCRWTAADIAHVMAVRYKRVMDTNGDNAPRDTTEDDIALIGLLCNQYQGTPDYWLHEAPIGVIEACVADWTRRQEQQATAYRKAGSGGPPVAPPPSPKFVAMRKFREACEKLEAKWLARNP